VDGADGLDAGAGERPCQREGGRQAGWHHAREEPGGAALHPRQPERPLDLPRAARGGVVAGEGLDHGEAAHRRRGDGEHEQRPPQQHGGVVDRRLRGGGVRRRHHRELPPFGGQRPVGRQLLHRRGERRVVGGASVELHEEAPADERVRVALDRVGAREPGRDRAEPAGHPDRADHADHGLGPVDDAVLEPGVEPEVVGLGEEPHRELSADGHVELPLEVVAQRDLDHARVSAGAGEAALEDLGLERRRRLVRTGGDAEERVLALDLGDGHPSRPRVADHRELDDVLEEVAVAGDRAAGVVDVGGLPEPVVGGAGAARQRNAADRQRADGPGEDTDEHHRGPPGSELGTGDGQDGRDGRTALLHPVGSRGPGRHARGMEPEIVAPAPGADRHSTVPPMAPRRSLMFT
jgi:hypothetical protein